MTQTKHAPGPWTFDQENYRIIGSHGKTIAQIRTHAANAATANARLIASAPMLLEKLKEAERFIKAQAHGKTAGWAYDLCRDISLTISEAEGQQ